MRGYVLAWLAGSCAASGTGHQPPAARHEIAGARTAAQLLFNLDGSDAQLRVATDTLKRADVVRDVRIARRDGERRLIGLYGYAVEVPGLDENGTSAPDGDVVVLVKGTSDFTRTDEQARFQQLVSRYAEKYNRGLLGLP